MSIIVLLIAAGGVVAMGFLVAFVWAVRSGQFDDVVSPAWRVLFDDAPAPVEESVEESVEEPDLGGPLHVRRHR
jgi:cbb3-type cytochrome oxidase maturation protein